MFIEEMSNILAKNLETAKKAAEKIKQKAAMAKKLRMAKSPYEMAANQFGKMQTAKYMKL